MEVPEFLKGLSKTTKWTIAIVVLILLVGIAWWYFGYYDPKKKLMATLQGTPTTEGTTQQAAPDQQAPQT